ncbi:MAG: Peptide/nickel transport system permease protein [Frankiales bacterium]|nr:Peptide/nickel transport system permease protein [Frankiales bacterium]
MILLLGRRLLLMVPILLVVSFLVFGLVVAVPGDPAITLAGDNATPERIAEIRGQLGLDDPLAQQYGRWVGGVVQGDLGASLFSGRPVATSIAERMPVTIGLATLSMIVALLISIPAGIIAATKRGRWPDRVATFLASAGLAMPSFFLGLVLVLVFSLQLGWLPATGYVPFEVDPVLWLKHMILPAITLGAAAAAETTRQLRSSLSDVLQQDYIRTARAKGTRAGSVIVHHALKNAAVPVVTVLGFQVAFLLGGSVIVEQIFALPGLGGLAIRAVIDRDIPVIQGVVVFAAVLVMVVNLAVDLLYGWLNPKIRTA